MLLFDKFFGGELDGDIVVIVKMWRAGKIKYSEMSTDSERELAGNEFSVWCNNATANETSGAVSDDFDETII